MKYLVIMAITFGMAIKVVSGFYAGCTGIVTDYSPMGGEYTVEMSCRMANGRTYQKSAYFQANELKEVK